MNTNLTFNQGTAILDAVDSQTLAPGAVSTGWFDANDTARIVAIVNVGTIAASGTLDAKLEQATDSSGTGAKDITGGAITQLTQAGGDSDKQVIIDVNGKSLDANNDFTHVRLTLTGAVGNVDLGALLLGQIVAYGQASDYNNASVAENVVV
jgi:hypothetical protein